MKSVIDLLKVRKYRKIVVKMRSIGWSCDPAQSICDDDDGFVTST